ncbi:Ribokinase [Corynebacterium capitovis DSM 44611]|uniref:ribokinase n=1 Tax=Corynebacterium capitovis TaxID=131081 RepID=UPI00036D5789|nr:ribokinase [Corynebacterium capitovis]WKD58364.1 Ribokinase [Corynebacterium capitovis DSM 44611]
MKSITVVGSINADLVVRVARHPLPGETLLGEGGAVTAGGKGANQAVAAANMGARVRLVGAVGTDPYAAPALEFLRSSGADLGAVDAVPGTTGLAVITVSDDGENTIVVVPGANAAVDAQRVMAHREAVTSADIVLLQGEIPASGFSQAVRLASGRVIVNLAPVVDVPRPDLLTADPLVANEHEAGLILAQFGVGDIPASEEDMARQLVACGFASVVLTRGARGAVVADGSGLTAIPTPAVEAVDSTGAGDAFVGALAHRLAEGDSLVEAATFAARVGAFAATRHGAQSSYPVAGDELPR